MKKMVKLSLQNQLFCVFRPKIITEELMSIITDKLAIESGLGPSKLF